MSEQTIIRSLYEEYRATILEPFRTAIRRYHLIEKGDRIAVCISGGKDSMLMARLFMELEKESDAGFSVVYLCMDPGYSPANRRKIEENAAILGIPLTIFESDVFEAANSTGSSPCYLCARMRRGCLYDKAQTLGCNKIALGHHKNDVIETTVMAMIYGAQLQGMAPAVASRNHPGMSLIRPLYCIREADIISWSQSNGLSFIQCACRFTEHTHTDENGNSTSKRKEIKLLLESLSKEDPQVEEHVFRSIHHVRCETFPGWKEKGSSHSFTEWFDPE